MARIGAAMTVSGDMPDFNAAAAAFPHLRWRILANVGVRAARELYSGALDEYLQPRSFSSTGAPMYGARRGVSFSISKTGDAVIVRSFPMNVYRSGKGPRTAKRTLGGKVFRSFKSSFNAQAAAADILERLLNGRDGIFSREESEEWETRLKKTKTNRPGRI
jgi:hypothetical protein